MLPESLLSKLRKKCDEHQTNKVLVQLPEGLKPKMNLILDELCKYGFDPVASADPCFGACDLKFIPRYITLHIGHSKMIEAEPVVYWEYRYDIDPWGTIEKHISEIKEEKLGLITTVQHIGFIDKVKEKLEDVGKTVLIGKPGPRVTYPGQVLGCDASSAISIVNDVDAYLYFGSGVFHPQFVAFQTRKPVYAIDPFSGEFQLMTWGRFEKESALRKTKAMNAKSIGVLTSTKPGQNYLDSAKNLSDRLRKYGYESGVIVAENLNPQIVDYLPYDAIVVMACPRIVLDDWKNYKKSILLPEEVEWVLRG